jgi:hypothetical protein
MAPQKGNEQAAPAISALSVAWVACAAGLFAIARAY